MPENSIAPIFSCGSVSGSPGAMTSTPHHLAIDFSVTRNEHGFIEINEDVPNLSQSNEGAAKMEKLRDMKIAKATKQYVFDEDGYKYLDCFNGVAHVGHSHPQIIAAATTQMSRVATSQGFKSDLLHKYVSRLAQTLPEGLDVVYMCNSGSEANDLALRLARQYTEQEDIVVTEDAFHGNLGVLIDISPKMHSYVPNYKAKDYVHITPLPSSYRPSDLIEPVSKDDLGNTEAAVAGLCADKVKQAFVEAENKGRGIAAFICEPCFIVSGVIIPHKSYYEKVYKTVRDHGALIIADETQTGLGRTGDHFWGFENFGPGLVPDIVTVGRPLGAGHPIGAVITSSRVSRKLGSYFSTFGGNPVSCAIGLAVLDVINNENLMSSARNVGKMLMDLLLDLKGKFSDWVGDIRGCGLVIGLEIVTDSVSKSPNSLLALNVMYSLKAQKVLVGIAGRHRNVIFIQPPMCFNIENCRRLVSCLEKVLGEYKLKADIEKEGEKAASSPSIPSSMYQGCIAVPVLSYNRNRRKHALDNNAHLFTVESPSNDDDNDYGVPLVEEQWSKDAKKAKMELEDYGDVD